MILTNHLKIIKILGLRDKKKLILKYWFITLIKHQKTTN